MQTHLTRLSTFELKDLNVKEKLEYFTSFPCRLFLDGIYDDFVYILNNYDEAEFAELPEVKGLRGLSRAQNIIYKISVERWESKIAKDLKTAIADAKK